MGGFVRGWWEGGGLGGGERGKERRVCVREWVWGEGRWEWGGGGGGGGEELFGRVILVRCVCPDRTTRKDLGSWWPQQKPAQLVDMHDTAAEPAAEHPTRMQMKELSETTLEIHDPTESRRFQARVFRSLEALEAGPTLDQPAAPVGCSSVTWLETLGTSFFNDVALGP